MAIQKYWELRGSSKAESESKAKLLSDQEAKATLCGILADIPDDQKRKYVADFEAQHLG
jgi:hypothetical protein